MWIEFDKSGCDSINTVELSDCFLKVFIIIIFFCDKQQKIHTNDIVCSLTFFFQLVVIIFERSLIIYFFVNASFLYRAFKY